MLFRCRFEHTRMGVGKGNVEVVNVYSLAVSSSPRVRAAAAREVLILHSDLEGGLPKNLISPRT